VESCFPTTWSSCELRLLSSAKSATGMTCFVSRISILTAEKCNEERNRNKGIVLTKLSIVVEWSVDMIWRTRKSWAFESYDAERIRYVVLASAFKSLSSLSLSPNKKDDLSTQNYWYVQRYTSTFEATNQGLKRKF
jgi:hypothetical protein